MTVVASKFYNNPELGQAFSNLASLYAPPSGSDLAGYSNASATKENAARLAEVFAYSKSKDYDPTVGDRMGIFANLYDPSQSMHAVELGDTTTRRSHDIQAQTQLSMNAADNENNVLVKLLDPVAADATRYVPPSLADVYKIDQTQHGFDKTGADNTAAMERRKAQDAASNEQAAFKARYGTPVGQNEMLPALPADTAARYNLPGSDPVIGAILAGQGDTVTLPNGKITKGADKPLTAEQWQAVQNERLRAGGLITDQDIVDATIGKSTPVVALKDNVPTYVTPGAAVREGMRAYDKGPSTVVNMTENGAKLGDPEPGLAWLRNPDGSVKTDERGAPIAVPYQGSKKYTEMQDAERAKASKTANQSVKNDIVAEDIDRALTSITSNPDLTTGLGAQLTSGIGNMPAHDVRALLDTIKANIGFDQLQAMREASPTGGALGQVTDNEQRLLQSVLGSLESSQSADQLTDNLRRLKNAYLDIIHGPGKGPEREALKFNQPASKSAAPRRAVNPATGEELILRDGKWERAQ